MKKDWMIKESELDQDQIQTLTATLDKSCIVAGCAGSGKSILALIKAQRIQRERPNSDYQIIVLTKALCGYMNAGREELGLNRQFTYHWKWQRNNCPKSDYVIVDEIQDFSKGEIAEFVSATRKNFFFFGDTAQSIYEGLKATMPLENIRLDIAGARNAKWWELYRNYRLPVPVARLAHHVGVGLEEFNEHIYASQEIAMPRVLEYASQDEQLQAIRRIMRKGDLEDVAILLPLNDKVKSTFERLSQMGGDFEVKYDDKADWRNRKNTLNFATTNPKIMTYHSAKGLQFETVFLPFLEDFVANSPSDRKALYVAMTRTYRNLYILHTGPLTAPLSSVDRALYLTQETDQVEDI